MSHWERTVDSAEQATVLREQEPRLAAEEERRRFTFLVEASAALASTLDYETTLHDVTRLAVPALADLCFLDIVRDGGELQRVAWAHADPARQEWFGDRWRQPPPVGHGGHPVARALRTGMAEFVPVVNEEWMRGSAAGPEQLGFWRDLNVHALLAAPLIARGRTIGALTFGLAAPERHYTAADLELAAAWARHAALMVDNARLYEETREAVRLRNEFLSNVSHDLKTPITAVKGMAQLLKRRTLRSGLIGIEGFVDGLETINTTATKMTAQIDELLDVARLQFGQPLELQQQLTELVALARRAIGDYQKQTQRHNLRVEAQTPGVQVVGDAVRLERVLSNLLSNAVKYTPGGGEIVLSVAQERDEAGAEWAVLAVRDQGIGIPAADLPHIFERFHRAANVTGHIAGTGIGLAGSRQIIEQHGGRMTAASAEGVGTTVTVRLPLEGGQ